MVMILFTTAIVAAVAYSQTLSLTTWIQLLVVGVLFVNAILMTVRIMPSTFGPSIQRKLVRLVW